MSCKIYNFEILYLTGAAIFPDRIRRCCDPSNNMSHYHTITLSRYHTITLAQYHTITVSHYHTIRVSHYHTTTISQYHTITKLLWDIQFWNLISYRGCHFPDRFRRCCDSSNNLRARNRAPANLQSAGCRYLRRPSQVAGNWCAIDNKMLWNHPTGQPSNWPTRILLRDAVTLE